MIVDLRAQASLEPVLKIARETARDVDATGEFPAATVDAMRSSGLLGLTLPTSAGGMGAGAVEFSEVVWALAEV